MTKTEILHKTTARLKGNPLWAFFLKITGKPIKQKKWIFIVGCYNSGTTLLDQILADHPEISGLPDEGVMLTNQLKRPEDFGWQRMWSECEDQITETFQSMDANIVKKHWSHFYDLRKEFLLEESISNALRIPFLVNNFQPPFFIHIIRNGYAVAEGIHRKAEILPENPLSNQNKYSLRMCAEQWVRSLKVIEENRTLMKNFVEISYESFSEEPEKTLKKITAFLNIKDFSEEYFNNSFAVHEKQSTIKNMNQNGFERLTVADLMEINSIAKEYLIKYGYEIRL